MMKISISPCVTSSFVLCLFKHSTIGGECTECSYGLIGRNYMFWVQVLGQVYGLQLSSMPCWTATPPALQQIDIFVYMWCLILYDLAATGCSLPWPPHPCYSHFCVSFMACIIFSTKSNYCLFSSFNYKLHEDNKTVESLLNRCPTVEWVNHITVA